MKYIQRYIFVLSLVSLMVSCGLDEPFEPQEQGPVSRQVELIARPTNFIRTNVATKATDPEIDAIENTVHTAYFLMYDNNGRLLRYENLTDEIKDGTVPSKTIMTDKGMTGVTVCYIANLAEEDVVDNMTATAEDNGITDLQKLQNAVMELDYRQAAKDGYIGIPGLDLDGKYSTPDVLCLPMMGVWQGDLTGASGQTAIEIQIKRLFAKIGFTVNLALADGTENATLAFEYFTVKNVPEKVLLFPKEDESQWVRALSSNFTDFPVADKNISIELGQGTQFFFYVPEYILYPDYEPHTEKDWYKNREQGYKPILADRKKATHVEFCGVLSRQHGQDMLLTYKIYLGGNEFDDFSLKRNYLYDNIITIENTTRDETDELMGIDHRVNIQYGGFLVGFQRATLLDSHFEVRPLRVKFAKNFIEEHEDNGGELEIRIINADNESATPPDWVRLERPTKAQLTASGAPYCLSGNKFSHTKRKYFTTDLVEKTLANNTVVSYDPFDTFDSNTYTGGDLNGEIPVWVYVDEYSANSSTDYSADAVRKAKVRVTFTPAGGGEAIYQDFTIQQRAIYPIISSGQPGHTYGIEYFEEYLHDYDSQDNYGAEGGEYYTSEDGIKWGFDGVQFSDTDWALYFTEDSGWINVNDWANAATENLDLNYDFYLTRDKDSSDDAITVHDYSGYEFNRKIISKENIESIDRRLNQNAQSVIEYCYNKNKRNSDGKVIYQYNTQDTKTETYTHREYYSMEETYLIFLKRTVYYEVSWQYESQTKYTYTHTNSDNLKWYAPAIDELEDIVENGVSNEFFRQVFEDNLYWSSQPAYHRNYFQYIIGPGEEIDLTLITIPARQRTSGVYMSDNIASARATKYDPINGTFISSDIASDNPKEGFYGGTTLYGVMTVDNYIYYPNATDGVFVYDRIADITIYWENIGKLLSGGSLSDVVSIQWKNDSKIMAATSYKKMDGVTAIELPEGIQPRTSEHRIRCIYNPNSQSETVEQTGINRTGFILKEGTRSQTTHRSAQDGITYTSVTSLPQSPMNPPTE